MSSQHGLWLETERQNIEGVRGAKRLGNGRAPAPSPSCARRPGAAARSVPARSRCAPFFGCLRLAPDPRSADPSCPTPACLHTQPTQTSCQGQHRNIPSLPACRHLVRGSVETPPACLHTPIKSHIMSATYRKHPQLACTPIMSGTAYNHPACLHTPTSVTSCQGHCRNIPSLPAHTTNIHITSRTLQKQSKSVPTDNHPAPSTTVHRETLAPLVFHARPLSSTGMLHPQQHCRP